MKKTRTLIIGSVVALLILCVIIGVVYFFINVFQSSKISFYKYVQTIDVLSFFDEEFYEQYNKKLAENKYEKTGNIDIRVLENTEEVFNGSFQYSTKTNKAEKLSQAEVDIIALGERIVSFTFLRNDDLYGILINDMFNEYIVLENKNLKELVDKLDLGEEYDVPNRLDFADKDNLFNLTGSERAVLKELGNKCIKIIDEYIPNKRYSKTGTKVIELAGEEATVNGYAVSLTEKDFQEISVKVLEAIKDNKEIFNIIKNRLGGIGLITFDDYQKIVDDSIVEIRRNSSNMNDSELNEAIYTLTVYEKDGTFAKLELNKNKDKNQTSISIEYSGNKKIMTCYEKEDTTERLLKLVKIENENEINWACTVQVAENGETTMELTANFSRIGSIDSSNIRHKADIKYVQGIQEIIISFNDNTKFVPRVQIDRIEDVRYTLLNDLTGENMMTLLNIITERIEKNLNSEETGNEGISPIVAQKRAELKEEIQMWRIEKAAAVNPREARDLEAFLIDMYNKELINELQVMEALESGSITIGEETIILVNSTELNNMR